MKAIRFSNDVKGLGKVLIDAQAGGNVGDLAPDCTDIETFRVAAPVGDSYGDYFVLLLDPTSKGYVLPSVKSKEELEDLIKLAGSGVPDVALFRVQNIIDAVQLDMYGNMPPSSRYPGRVPNFYLYENANPRVKNEGEDILVNAGGSWLKIDPSIFSAIIQAGLLPPKPPINPAFKTSARGGQSGPGNK